MSETLRRTLCDGETCKSAQLGLKFFIPFFPSLSLSFSGFWQCFTRDPRAFCCCILLAQQFGKWNYSIYQSKYIKIFASSVLSLTLPSFSSIPLFFFLCCKTTRDTRTDSWLVGQMMTDLSCYIILYSPLGDRFVRLWIG